MSPIAWILLIAHMPILVWLVHDRFKTVNIWADIFEFHVLPHWFRWDARGDWVSWVQHGLICLIVSLYAGCLSFLAPESFVFGAMLGGLVAWAVYWIREIISGARSHKVKRPHMWTHPDKGRVGWAVDGIMDAMGGTIVASGWTLLWLIA